MNETDRTLRILRRIHKAANIPMCLCEVAWNAATDMYTVTIELPETKYRAEATACNTDEACTLALDQLRTELRDDRRRGDEARSILKGIGDILVGFLPAEPPMTDHDAAQINKAADILADQGIVVDGRIGPALPATVDHTD